MGVGFSLYEYSGGAHDGNVSEAPDKKETQCSEEDLQSKRGIRHKQEGGGKRSTMQV